MQCTKIDRFISFERCDGTSGSDVDSGRYFAAFSCTDGAARHTQRCAGEEKSRMARSLPRKLLGHHIRLHRWILSTTIASVRAKLARYRSLATRRLSLPSYAPTRTRIHRSAHRPLGSTWPPRRIRSTDQRRLVSQQPRRSIQVESDPRRCQSGQHGLFHRHASYGHVRFPIRRCRLGRSRSSQILDHLYTRPIPR